MVALGCRCALALSLASRLLGAGAWSRSCGWSCSDYRIPPNSSTLNGSKLQCELEAGCFAVVDFSHNGGGAGVCSSSARFVPWSAVCVETKGTSEAVRADAAPAGAERTHQSHQEGGGSRKRGTTHAAVGSDDRSRQGRGDVEGHDSDLGGHDDEDKAAGGGAGGPDHREDEDHDGLADGVVDGRGGAASDGRNGETTPAPELETYGELCPRGIGAAASWPDMEENILGPHPTVYKYAIPVSFASMFVVVAIALPTLVRLDAGPRAATIQRRCAMQMRVVAAVPAIIAFFKLSAVLAPRSWKILFFSAACYEVYAFWTFLQLILGFVTEVPDKVVDVLMQGHPAKVWSVPPLGCCFKPCTTPRYFSHTDLFMIRLFMWQFILVLPTIAALEMSESLPENIDLILTRLETASLVLAMFGLFALLEATHDCLGHLRLHSKFWTIKGTFVANSLLFRIASSQVHNDVKVGGYCYTSQTIAAAAASAVTALLCVPLMALSRHAYRAEDIHGSECQDAVTSELIGP